MKETKKVEIVIRDGEFKGVNVSDGIEVWVADEMANIHKKISTDTEKGHYYEVTIKNERR